MVTILLTQALPALKLLFTIFLYQQRQSSLV